MEHRPYVIGITGGIGAGKSTVVEFLRDCEMHEQVFDCDATVHELYNNDIMLAWLEEKFGPLGDNPRQTMSCLVQSAPSVLDQLGRMFLPGIKMKLREFRLQHEYSDFILIDAPLLLEFGLDKDCDSVVVVHCPEAERRRRVANRPGMTPQKLDLMISRQLNDEGRLARADFVIDNSGTPDEAETNMIKVFDQLEVKFNEHWTVRGLFRPYDERPFRRCVQSTSDI